MLAIYRKTPTIYKIFAPRVKMAAMNTVGRYAMRLDVGNYVFDGREASTSKGIKDADVLALKIDLTTA